MTKRSQICKKHQGLNWPRWYCCSRINCYWGRRTGTTCDCCCRLITERLTTLMKKLTERVKQLELKHTQEHGTGENRKAFSYKARGRGRGRGGTGIGGCGAQESQRSVDVECWNCGLTGHIDQNCRQILGNWRPPLDMARLTRVVRMWPAILQLHKIPAGGYHLEAIVNRIQISLLLDTVAAVLLLRRHLTSWKSQKWRTSAIPLHIHGYTTATVELGGAELQVEMVVVSPLTTEAILGFDFLSTHRANINSRKEEVHLNSCPSALKLICKMTAQVKEDTTIPPNSQLEVLTCIHGPVNDQTWLLEDVGAIVQHKQNRVMVARSLVISENQEVPVQILNPHNSPMTISKYTTIATLEKLDADARLKQVLWLNQDVRVNVMSYSGELWRSLGGISAVVKRKSFYCCQCILTYLQTTNVTLAKQVNLSIPAPVKVFKGYHPPAEPKWASWSKRWFNKTSFNPQPVPGPHP